MKKVVPVWWFAVPHDAICLPRQRGLSWPGAAVYPTAPHAAEAGAAADSWLGEGSALEVVELDGVVVDGWTVEVTVTSTGSDSPEEQADRMRSGKANAAAAAVIRENMAHLNRELTREIQRRPANELPLI